VFYQQTGLNQRHAQLIEEEQLQQKQEDHELEL
jgi:hypothetical protein